MRVERAGKVLVAAITVAGAAAGELVFGGRDAAAAVEVWSQFEHEVTLTDSPGVLPDAVELATDVRYGSRMAGLERVQLRWGPRWELGGPLSLGINHTAYLQQPDPGAFVTEQRAELEPELEGAWGPIAWSNRGRLELRLRPAQTRWRFRDELRLEGELGQGWRPFVSDEVFFDLSGGGFNENRIALGLAREVGGVGWELAYTLRTRHVPSAYDAVDHLVTLAWLNAARRSSLLGSRADAE